MPECVQRATGRRTGRIHQVQPIVQANNRPCGSLASRFSRMDRPARQRSGKLPAAHLAAHQQCHLWLLASCKARADYDAPRHLMHTAVAAHLAKQVHAWHARCLHHSDLQQPLGLLKGGGRRCTGGQAVGIAFWESEGPGRGAGMGRTSQSWLQGGEAGAGAGSPCRARRRLRTGRQRRLAANCAKLAHTPLAAARCA